MGDVAGWLVLGTTLETNDFDKKYKKLKSKLDKQELDLEVKASGVDNVKKEIQQLNKEMQKVIDKRNELNEKIQSKQNSLNELLAKPNKTDEDNEWIRMYKGKIFNLKGQQESLNQEVDIYNDKLNKLNDKLTKAETSYKKQAENVRETKDEIIQVQEQIKKNNLKEIKDNAKNIKNETEGIIKKLARWGLAIFSVRSAYMFIRQSVSTLSQYNEKIGADIEYIRFALATSLKPLIEGIIKLVYKLLAYVGYLAKAWFGVDLFANASAKSFEKAKKEVSGTNKEAKKLQKTLAGFDEMNILQDGNTKTGGGGGGITLPTEDLTKMGEVPKWLEGIAANGELVKNVLIGIGLAIAGLKLTQLVFGLSGINTTLPSIVNALGAMSGLQIFGLIGGIGIALVGVYETIKNLITWIQDPSWGTFNGVLSGLETILIGVGVALVAVNAANPIGWITLAVGAIGKLITKLSEDEKKTLDLTDAKNKLNNAEKEFVNAQNKYTTALKNRDQALKDLRKAEKETKLSGEELYKSVITGKLKYDDMTKTQQNVYLAYLKYKGSLSDVETATKDLQKEEHELILTSLEEQATVAATKNDFEEFSKTLNKLVDEGTVSVDEAYKIINNVFGKMEGLSKDVFGIQFPKNFKASTDSADKLLKKVQNLYSQWKKLKDAGFPSTSGSSYSSKSVWAKGGVLTYAQGGVYKPIKLASGAVINQPNRGVPIGPRAIGGEHGAEGIVPLTDAQQMDLLGSAIGRRVTVNLTNITEMNGRIIGKELRRIQNDEDFAFNG